jgi:predicted  nucleic acid-binding Zn-ribbon protein
MLQALDTIENVKPYTSPRNKSESHVTSESQSNFLKISPDKHIDYINKLENDFDRLMKRKQQLDAQLTRLPPKSTNTNMHIIKHTLENEISSNDHKLASVKLELRKLNIIKTTH